MLKFQQYHKMKDALKNSGMEWGCSNEQAELERDFGEVAKSSVSELQKRCICIRIFDKRIITINNSQALGFDWRVEKDGTSIKRTGH